MKIRSFRWPAAALLDAVVASQFINQIGFSENHGLIPFRDEKAAGR
jgi:hypothetical protein